MYETITTYQESLIKIPEITKLHYTVKIKLAWEYFIVNISLCKHIHGTVVHSAGPFHIIFNYYHFVLIKMENYTKKIILLLEMQTIADRFKCNNYCPILPDHWAVCKCYMEGKRKTISELQ